MYLSMLLLYLGIAVLVNVVWLLLFFPLLFLLVEKLVVRREENYLERKFGDDYQRYRTRVRRWI
jgi:protein-S-isoprenylcysteine O-methyltransferase Ste14